MKTKKIVIIGAGLGGTSTAMLLAHRGFDVTIVEKRSVIGGRNAELKIGDFSFDTGPTFLHTPWLIEEAFAEAGEKMSDHLNLKKIDPFNHIVYSDKRVKCYTDSKAMHNEIATKFPGLEKNYYRYLEKERKLNKALFPCLMKPYLHWYNMFRLRLIKAAPHVFSRDSVYSKLGKFFPEEKLQMSMAFQTKYLGMTPWKCPGFLSILSSWEYLYGIYHPIGGLCELSKSMAKVAQSKGAKLRLSTPIKTVVTKNKKITGVQTEDGEIIEADEVIMNADMAYALTHLLGKKNVPEKKMKKKPMSCSALLLYLGMKREYPEQPHHQIVMAEDYKGWTSVIDENKEIPDDMAVYVRNASVTDKTLAPKGKCGLYLLVPVPNNQAVHNWKERAPKYREKIIDRVIERTGMKDLRENIECETMITPDDWEGDLNVFMGATFSLKHTLDQMLYFRPHNKHEAYKNLYLVGGGTHPGSGVIPIIQSGRIAAEMVSKKYNIPYEEVDLHTEKL